MLKHFPSISITVPKAMFVRVFHPKIKVIRSSALISVFLTPRHRFTLIFWHNKFGLICDD